MNKVSKFLKEVRTRLDLSEEALANHLKISRRHLRDVESGKFKRPDAYIKRLFPYMTVEEKRELVVLLATESAKFYQGSLR